MSSARLPLCSPTPWIRTTINPNPKPFSFYTSTTRNRKSYDYNSPICKAASSNSSSSSSSIEDFDLYDLLGIDSSSDQANIKQAYRTLQKRCHPDIAGPAGHDMAIVLNEAYALLSDPNSRFLYDKEQAKIEGLKGYTGKPLYSAWFGSESEERAVFVDEVKCVGCLKCALFAEKTFAIESVYGRARVVAQWADTEDKIQEAIDACPVDCISVVERSNLAALEFLMSKQPRGKVRIGAGNTAGIRVSNIFDDVEKFRDRFQEGMDKTSAKNSKESDLQRESRMSAIQTIRSISNWLYWQPPIARGSRSQSGQHMKLLPQKSSEPDLNKLRDVAAARKHARETAKPTHKVASNHIVHDEYWVPTLVLPEAITNNTVASEFTPKREPKVGKNESFVVRKKRQSSPFVSNIPIGIAIVAAVIAQQAQLGEGASGGLEEHIYGSLALDFVNSSWLPVILTGTTWYFIGLYVVQVVEAVQSKIGKDEK